MYNIVLALPCGNIIQTLKLKLTMNINLTNKNNN